MHYKTIYPLIILYFCYGCVSVQKADFIDDGYYKIKYTSFPHLPKDSMKVDTFHFSKKGKYYVEDYLDSLLIFDTREDSVKMVIPVKITNENNLSLQRNSFDVDLFTIPLKIRFSKKNMPTQLTVEYNAAMYFGYRKDFIKVSSATKFLNSIKRKIIRNGVGGGMFVGISSTSMNPWVSNNHINSEYNGLVATYGVACIYEVQKFNAGIAIGQDHLFDRNRHWWIYQDKVWIGILLGFNLN